MIGRLIKIFFIGCVIVMSLSAQTQENMQNILIYSGPGVGSQSLKNTVAMLKQIVADKYRISTVGPDTLIGQEWLKNTALLVIPGGADRPYLEKLQGMGNTNIRNYVANGGKFLGICAGSYYSADRIEFAKGDKALEVIGERELKFFPGLVSGPTYAGFDHRDLNLLAGTRAAKLYWQLDQPFPANKELIIFYNGGGSFIDAEKYPNVKILARYSPEIAGDLEYPAAIVECSIGQGRVILSSPHFEWEPESLDETKSSNISKIKPSLIAANVDRLTLAKYLLVRLDINT